MNVLGIDVGAGAVKFAVFPGSGQPLHNAEEKTARSYPELKAQILGIISRLKRTHDIRAVGIGIPGFISSKEHIIEISPNMLFLNGIALESDLAAGIGLPVAVENDANAAALGEFSGLNEPRPVPPQGDAGNSARPAPQGDAGNSARPACFVHLTLGSGIGSGIILDGRVWHGACGFAAELGHLLVNSQGRACGCGNNGCAETESSEAGIVRSYQEYAGSPSPLSSRDVFALLQKGDEPARRAFQRAGSFLGVLLGQIVYALNPEWISIGGGVAAAGEALLGPAREELARRVIAKAFACTRIEPARLGNAAGITGAAVLARQLLP
jgi:glucokinase